MPCPVSAFVSMPLISVSEKPRVVNSSCRAEISSRVRGRFMSSCAEGVVEVARVEAEAEEVVADVAWDAAWDAASPEDVAMPPNRLANRVACFTVP